MKPMSVKAYKILIVNHEESVHEMINSVLKDMFFLNFKLEIINVYSSKEAKSILENNNRIALTLIDTDMESLDESLELVHYIREQLQDSLIRIVLVGDINEHINIDYIKNYDINDYKNRSELSYEHIFTTLRTSIIQYKQLVELGCKKEDRYKQMTTDSLTHLYNRVKLYEDSNDNINQTLILIDIIGFSRINEHYGYDTGDMVLKEFAAFLYTMYHEDFNVYHLDNDLFALILTADILYDIFDAIEDIKDDILKLNIITNNFKQTLDISIGVAYQSEKNILRKAELALKEARDLGVNQIKYYADDLKVITRINNLNYWGPIINEKLNNEDILVYYQPIYNLKTNTIEKYELLMRIEHKGEICLPIQFLDVAYNRGQTYDIFKFMFTKACESARNTGMKFSVNIGDSEFKNDDIVEFITNTVSQYGVNPRYLSLEILEYHSICSEPSTKDKIIDIHDLGIQIAIDDFGINCSNFGQMQNLPIDIIKIDGSFIENIAESKNSQIIVKTIQTFAKEKNIKLVAEYISSIEVLETIAEMGIKYGQGNYLCKPLESIEST